MHRPLITMLGAILVMCMFTVDAATLSLDCPLSMDEREEQTRIRKRATAIAERTSKHMLQVTVNGNVLRFIDKPPYDEPEGSRYRFCDRKDGHILILAHVDDVITGKLIHEASGAMTPGGESVIFSADKRSYFTSEQPNGLDGNVWNLYRTDGSRIWTGFSFIARKTDPDAISAFLAKPKWDANGMLVAQASCLARPDTTWKVKLMNTAGNWNWSPKRTCPKK